MNMENLTTGIRNTTYGRYSYPVQFLTMNIKATERWLRYLVIPSILRLVKISIPHFYLPFVQPSMKISLELRIKDLADPLPM